MEESKRRLNTEVGDIELVGVYTYAQIDKKKKASTISTKSNSKSNLFQDKIIVNCFKSEFIVQSCALLRSFIFHNMFNSNLVC